MAFKIGNTNILINHWRKDKQTQRNYLQYYDTGYVDSFVC